MVAKLLVVGGGKMGEAVVKGLLRSHWATPEELTVSEVSEVRRVALAATEELGGVRFVGGDLPPAEGAVIAVKPADVEGVCRLLSGITRVLSIAAGVRLAQLEAWCGPGTAVVRAMPNTPALVGAAATAIAAAPARAPRIFSGRGGSWRR